MKLKHREAKELALNGDTTTQTFVNNLGGLRRYLSRFFSSKHDIEDVLQEAYVKAIESEKSNEITAPKAFLYKVSKNLAINYHKSAARRLTDYIEDFEEAENIASGPSLEHQVEQEYRLARFCDAVKLLPPQCRRVFVLKKVYAIPNIEIAKRMGISINTVNKHLSKGTLMCQKYLEHKGYEGSQKHVAESLKRSLG